MLPTKNLETILFAGVAVVLSASVVLADTSEKLESQPFRIGAVLALTGAAQAFGKYAREGAQLAVDEVNAEGGINGRSVELIIEDSRSNPTTGVSAMQKLTSVDHVQAVIGDVWAYLTNPLIPIAEQTKTPLVSPTVVRESVERPQPYFYTLGARIETVGEAVDLFFDLHKSARTAGIFCWDDPWGNAYLNIWRSSAQSRNIKIVKELCNPADYNRDYRTEARQMVAAKPDLLIVAYHTERILRRLNELNFHRPVLSANNIAGVVLDGTLPPTLSEGAYFTDWLPNNDYSRRFFDRFKEKPMIESHSSYEAVRAITEALKKEPSAPLRALSNLKLMGVAGPIDFSRDFAANFATAKLYVVRKGNIEPAT